MWSAIGAAIDFGKDMYNAREARKQGKADRSFQQGINTQNYEMQKEFAQHGIRWKLKDAKVG